MFCLALSRRLAVSGSFDHSVCVWDRLSPAPAPYALVRKMAGLHADMVYGVAVNAAGVLLRWKKHFLNSKKIITFPKKRNGIKVKKKIECEWVKYFFDIFCSCSHDSVLCVYKFDRETTTVDHLGYLEGKLVFLFFFFKKNL